MHNEQMHISVEPNIRSQIWKWSVQATITGWRIHPGNHWLWKKSVGLWMKTSLLHNKVTKEVSVILGYTSSRTSRSSRLC